MKREEFFDLCRNPQSLNADLYREACEVYADFMQELCDMYNNLPILPPDKYLPSFEDFCSPYNDIKNGWLIVNDLTPIQEKIKASNKPFTDATNVMGCSENWYNTYYAISHTFTEEEINNFSLETLEALEKLGDRLSEAFY